MSTGSRRRSRASLPPTQTLHVVEGRPLAVSLRLWVMAVDRLVVTADKLGERDAQASASAIERV